MIVIIAGSRSFSDYDLLDGVMTMFMASHEIDEIVSGTARGTDTLGAKWGRKNGIPVKEFPADWHKYGKSAGIIRNKEMGNYADWLIAFWDRKSKGTKHMMEYMYSIGKKVNYVLFE